MTNGQHDTTNTAELPSITDEMVAAYEDAAEPWFAPLSNRQMADKIRAGLEAVAPLIAAAALAPVIALAEQIEAAEKRRMRTVVVGAKEIREAAGATRT